MAGWRLSLTCCATTVMVQALAAGCEAVIPCAEIEEAKRSAAGLPAGSALLSGERQGLPIQGFDLGNSPGEFVPDVCRGKTLVMTTTNGTRAILASLTGDACLHRQFHKPACDIRRDLGPVPQKRPWPLGPHRLRGYRGPGQPGG